MFNSLFSSSPDNILEMRFNVDKSLLFSNTVLNLFFIIVFASLRNDSVISSIIFNTVIEKRPFFCSLFILSTKIVKFDFIYARLLSRPSLTMYFLVFFLYSLHHRYRALQ